LHASKKRMGETSKQLSPCSQLHNPTVTGNNQFECAVVRVIADYPNPNPNPNTNL